MALPRGTTGSLAPTLVPARPVGLAVRPACALARGGWFPTSLSRPSRASVTLWEATAPVKLPATRGPGPGSRGAVRQPTARGWYFKGASAGPGGPASSAPTYPTMSVLRLPEPDNGSAAVRVAPTSPGATTERRGRVRAGLSVAGTGGT